MISERLIAALEGGTPALDEQIGAQLRAAREDVALGNLDGSTALWNRRTNEMRGLFQGYDRILFYSLAAMGRACLQRSADRVNTVPEYSKAGYEDASPAA